MAEPASFADRDDADDDAPPQVGISRWAVLAFGTSLALFCPLLTIIGPLLGLRALVQIRAHPGRTGRGMALAAIWIGCIGCVGWIILLIWWNTNVRRELLQGPQTALALAFAGENASFKERFIGDGAAADNARIKAFIDPLRERYGRFQSAMQDDSAPAPTQDGGRSVVIPYVLQFEGGPVKADTRILLFAKFLAPRLESITVKDAERGDLTYP